jgi:heme-degrading monooxygenase HmoA
VLYDCLLTPGWTLASFPGVFIFNVTLPTEVAMIAKIIIKRRFVKENTPQILSLLNKIRTIAMNQSGYISGETLKQSEFPENMAIISSWQSMEDWNAWKNSDARKTYEAMLEIYQTRPTQYEEYLLGTSFHGDQ